MGDSRSQHVTIRGKMNIIKSKEETVWHADCLDPWESMKLIFSILDETDGFTQGIASFE